MTKRKLSELITDPQSGQLSASRLCLLVLILGYLPVLAGLEAVGVKITIWAHLTVIVGSVCGVYGINTGLRVWRGKVYHDKEGE